MKKNLNVVVIVLMLVLTGLYVGDYFLVESYKSVPVYFVHIFGNDLTNYKVFDHVLSSVFLGAILIFMIVYLVVMNKKKK